MKNFTLKNFEGPLELLLYLIKKAKIDIKDIFISEITEQYLSFVELNSAEMDDISEFLSMAATLLFIKSRRLLPELQLEGDENEEDIEQKLISSLEEYSKIKSAGEKMLKYIENAPQTFTRYKADFVFDDQKYDIDAITLQKLHVAFKELLENIELENELPAETARRVTKKYKFTLNDKIRLIREKLKEKNGLYLDELLDENDKQDVVITFLSVLELLHIGGVCLKQSKPFERILVSYNL